MKHTRGVAFTLIELLVVVAIVAVLAAMLLPALNQARDTAKTAHCMNNLKHIAVAAIMYANDNNDVLPDTCPEFAQPFDNWMQAVSEYMKLPPAPFTDIRSGPEYRYPLLCPATSGRTSAWDPYCGSAWAGYATDYAMNHHVAGGSRLLTGGLYWAIGRKLSKIPMPHMTALLADSETYNGWLGFAYYTISPRHKSRTRANVVCVDGHVESLKVPWPTWYTDYNLSTAELGVIHPSTAATSSSWEGPGFKVYMHPPGVLWMDY